MPVSSALVDGEGIAGRIAAIALAQLGLEVTLVERAGGPSAPAGSDQDGGTLSALRSRGILPHGGEEPTDLTSALADRARELGIETRPDCALVGSVKVDRHVEAELSDGRVENYDVIVVTADAASLEPADGAPRPVWRVVAGGDVEHLDEVAAVSRALEALALRA